jgi:hypothetical protein
VLSDARERTAYSSRFPFRSVVCVRTKRPTHTKPLGAHVSRNREFQMPFPLFPERWGRIAEPIIVFANKLDVCV